MHFRIIMQMLAMMHVIIRDDLVDHAWVGEHALGFDERFIRMWEYYLAISEAGFDTGRCQDYQIVLQKGRAIA